MQFLFGLELQWCGRSDTADWVVKARIWDFDCKVQIISHQLPIFSTSVVPELVLYCISQNELLLSEGK